MSASHSSSISHIPAATSKYSVKYGGKAIETTVTDKAAVADEWVQEIRNKYSGNAKVVVGLDVEWKPTDAINVKPATLQLCINDKCLILQLLHMEEFPTSLKRFFMDSKFTFVGVEIEKDISKITEKYGLEFRNREDIRELAMSRNKYGITGDKTSLKDLAMVVCNIHLKKPVNVQASDWEASTLSSEQVEYACMDSYASYCVGHKLVIG
ncbi:Werner Syndrome-like exonuclease [Neltuma alba]|uniref:Werner Syndrome-like exonuclease n=1 Tax=Neltuma alba TaxID=207710 RepID=UPI0010A31AB3|nr:Werner Syndrome-like exonuclease [Prosopis alba]